MIQPTSDTNDANAFREFDELMRVCRTAVRKARQESHRLGVANVYAINGQHYYELPDGQITRTPPGE